MFLALGIIKLRTMKGEPQAGEFKVPLVPVLPLISIVVCAALMFQLSLATWQVFGVAVVVWLFISFMDDTIVSFVSRQKNKMNEKERNTCQIDRCFSLFFLAFSSFSRENRQEI